MDETPKPVNSMRTSTKAGITLGAFLLALHPLKELKDFFMGEQQVTNARIEQTMKEGFNALTLKIDTHIEAETGTHRRMRDVSHDEVATSETRCEKRSDKIESRVSNLEIYAFTKGRKQF